MNLVWIAAGGAVGTLARHLLGSAMERSSGLASSVVTIGINVVGSFLLALVFHAGVTKGAISSEMRLVLGTGVLGGFTTYSTFNQDTLVLLQRGLFGQAAGNVVATVGLGLAAGALGLLAARAWLGG